MISDYPDIVSYVNVTHFDSGRITLGIIYRKSSRHHPKE
jgi:hypothetical protein